MLQEGAIDVVVMPSIVTAEGDEEGIPVSLMEAMAHGVPVVATSTGGMPELLSDGAGLLVPSGDADAIARAVERLIVDQESYATTAERGRARVAADFNVDKIAARLRQLFEEAMA